MSPYLVTRLRNAYANGDLCREAANEIERLRDIVCEYELREADTTTPGAGTGSPTGNHNQQDKDKQHGIQR